MIPEHLAISKCQCWKQYLMKDSISQTGINVYKNQTYKFKKDGKRNNLNIHLNKVLISGNNLLSFKILVMFLVI